jgi:ParB family chromosome partitioning protein
MKIKCEYIVPNPQQPRVDFNQEDLETLAQSIEENGLIQPVVVEQAGTKFILIDGERRWRAHLLLGLPEIEAVIRPSSNGSGSRERLFLALAANLQRTDLRPIEEAEAYSTLRNQLGMSITEITQRVGRTSTHVYSRIKLLDFPAEVQSYFNSGRLPLDERVFNSLRKLELEDQVRIARAAVLRQLTVHGICSICTRILNGYAYDTTKKTPAMEGGRAHTYKTHTPTDVKDAMLVVEQHAGVVAWERIAAAARETCREDCVLFEDASPKMCANCPAKDLIRRIEKQE